MDRKVETHQKTFSSANILTVEAGTNTPMGGDAGHGGITILKLRDDGATAWKLKCDTYEREEPKEVSIELYGDTEAETFIQSLEFAIRIIKAQMLLKTGTS